MITDCNIFWGSKIGKHLQLCGEAHYRATRKNLDSRTQLDETGECASGDDLLLLYKILHLIFSLWYEFFAHYALRVEKIINMVLMWTFRISVSSSEGMSHQTIQNSVALFRSHRQNPSSHLP